MTRAGSRAVVVWMSKTETGVVCFKDRHPSAILEGAKESHYLKFTPFQILKHCY